MTIKEIFESMDSFSNKDITLEGWITSNRGNKKIVFLNLNDGSTITNIQMISKDEETINALENARVGSSLSVSGTVLLTPSGKQPLEFIIKKINSLDIADESFPIQKNVFTQEVLREIPELRHRTNIFRSVMRIRSTLFNEIHSFFNSEGFINMNTPIITGNDGEGAGEAFEIISHAKKDFFGKKASLTVTGQLHAEAYANGFKKVYTFGPTFRAENSHTQRHASEFWMLEPEVCFMDLNGIIHHADKMLRSVISNTIEKQKPEFEYLEEKLGKKTLSTLKKYLDSEIKILDYKDAIDILIKNKSKFENKDISFGIDLNTEHERYLAEEHAKGPIAITNFPKDIKAFYMYQNTDGKTVASFDLLVPGIGELIGGSQRESDYNKLLKRLDELNIPSKDLQWYLDLRKYGYPGSSGFGLGFERLVMYVTGVDNIRDSIPFPRTPNSLLM